MSYSIIKNSLDTLILPLGSSFLHPNTETSLIEEKLIITPKKEYGFWSRKLLKALNSGLITQLVYDAIKDNENEEKYFVHVSSLSEEIVENDKVQYELEQGMKGLNAVRVVKL